MRDPRGVVQEASSLGWTGGKDYSRGTNFTCIATSGDGYVAVGSKVCRRGRSEGRGQSRGRRCRQGQASPRSPVPPPPRPAVFLAALLPS